MKAIPKITVRIDRGDDWVEISDDWQTKVSSIPICGAGKTGEWCDLGTLQRAWDLADKAVME